MPVNEPSLIIRRKQPVYENSPLPIIVFARLLMLLDNVACPSLFGFLAVASVPRSASSSCDARGSTSTLSPCSTCP